MEILSKLKITSNHNGQEYANEEEEQKDHQNASNSLPFLLHQRIQNTKNAKNKKIRKYKNTKNKKMQKYQNTKNAKIQNTKEQKYKKYKISKIQKYKKIQNWKNIDKQDIHKLHQRKCLR